MRRTRDGLCLWVKMQRERGRILRHRRVPKEFCVLRLSQFAKHGKGHSMKIMIIGAGIGGLTTALALHKAGHQVEVFEQVPEIKALGVGINLLPHAVGVLSSFGLAPELARVAIEAQEYVFMNRHGQEILADARGSTAGYAFPQYSIHRGDLQMILLAAAQQALGAEQIRVGHKLASFTQDERGVDALFTDRAGNERGRFHADIMIASDGIHSVVRSHYYPDEGMPLWNGTIMWRGTTVGKPFLTGGSVVKAGWTSQKFIVYPISKQHADRGEALINWIADLHFDNTNLMEREDWNRPGKIEDFLPAFESWKFPWLDVPEVIRNAQSVFEFPMVDRDPVAQWSFGRVVLLGDAAHPMYPISSNGATQAIIDAQAITESLASIADPVAALKDFQDKRLPVASQIVRMNRQEGPDVILDIVNERAPDGFKHIDDVIAREELLSIVGGYKKAAGHQQRSAA